MAKQLFRQRWVFTVDELNHPERCTGDEQFSTGPLPCGPPDSDGQVPLTEEGMIVLRNGTVSNHWNNGSLWSGGRLGIPAHVVEAANDVESYISRDGKATVFDIWRDVECDQFDKFVRFV